MEITIQELNLLDKENYQLIDIRSEVETAHGAIPGAIVVSSEDIEENQKIDFSKKLVICCSRGEFSLETAGRLAEKGYDSSTLSCSGGRY